MSESNPGTRRERVPTSESESVASAEEPKLQVNRDLLIARLRGSERPYPTYGAKLDLAHQAGLHSLVTTVLQLPSPENGRLAVVMATAEFANGDVFTDVGDACPESTSPQMASALLRLASTRAKGRVLSDALNLPELMAEEAEDMDSPRLSVTASGGTTPLPAHRAGTGDRPPAAGAPTCVYPVEGGPCGEVLTQSQLQKSMKKWNKRFCAAHDAQADRLQATSNN